MRAQTIEAKTNPVLSFHVREDAGRPWWSYLDVNGEPGYLISNACGTCSAIFERVGDARLPLAPDLLSEKLRNGITSVSQEIIDTVITILPSGTYYAHLLTVPPLELRRKDPPNKAPYVSCEADYFWYRQISSGKTEAYNEIVLPLVAESALNEARIAYYQERIYQGFRPTALALSILDFRAIRGEYEETILAHFLIDGHHKIMAASRLGMPLSILSFLSVTQSITIARVEEDPFVWKYYRLGG